jgi:hypothetical protein
MLPRLLLFLLAFTARTRPEPPGLTELLATSQTFLVDRTPSAWRRPARLVPGAARLGLRGGVDDDGADLSRGGAKGLTQMCARHLEEQGPSAHAASAQELSALVLSILRGATSDLQNELLDLLGYDALDLISWVLKHSHLLKGEEEAELADAGAPGGAGAREAEPAVPQHVDAAPGLGLGMNQGGCRFRSEVSGERKVNIVWHEDSEHLLTEATILPPRGGAHLNDALSSQELVPVTAFGPYLSHALPPHVTTLNAVQSRVFHEAFLTSQNLLVLAPTGAGKTMVAVSVIFREILKQKEEEEEMMMPRHIPSRAMDDDDLDDARGRGAVGADAQARRSKPREQAGAKRRGWGTHRITVYIAPLKALASEVTRTLGGILEKLDPPLTALEVTGDVDVALPALEAASVLVAYHSLRIA